LVQSIVPNSDVKEIISCFNKYTQILISVTPNFIIELSSHMEDAYPNDLNFSKQWSFLNGGQKDKKGQQGQIDADIDIVRAWDLGFKDCSSLVIAVLDSGIRLEHPDLKENLWINTKESGPGEPNGVDDDVPKNGYVDDKFGFDAVDIATEKVLVGGLERERAKIPFEDKNKDGPDDSSDKVGHGTMVASIIAAKGENKKLLSGICQTAKIMPVRITFEFTGTLFAMVQGLKYILKQIEDGVPIKVLNASVTMPQVIDIYVLLEKISKNGVLIVKTAGNYDADLDDGSPRTTALLRKDAPCKYRTFEIPGEGMKTIHNIICVAAHDNKFERWYDKPGSGSNWGVTSVELAAPGETIAMLNNTKGSDGKWGLKYFNGTSFAAPHVSGVAALGMSTFDLDAHEVKVHILDGSTTFPPASGVLEDRNWIGKVKHDGVLRWPYAGDLGDAPDSFVTIHTKTGGPIHWDIGTEFFGRDVTPEVDADKAGGYDQDFEANIVGNDHSDWPRNENQGGGSFGFSNPIPHSWKVGDPIKYWYTVCTDHAGIIDSEGGRYSPQKVYVSAWADLNRDLTFQVDKEQIISDALSDGGSPFPTATAAGIPKFPPKTKCFISEGKFTVPPFSFKKAEDEKNDIQFRFRLNYGSPPMGSTSDYGEIEDFSYDVNNQIAARPPYPPFSHTDGWGDWVLTVRSWTEIGLIDVTTFNNAMSYLIEKNIPAFDLMNTEVPVIKGGIIIIDTDNDGIPDSIDSCLTEAENYNGYQDSDGCPDEKPVDTFTLDLPIGIVYGGSQVFDWPDVQGATSYTILIFRDGQMIVNIPGLTVSNWSEGVFAEDTFTWKVIATVDGQSVESNTASFTVQPAPSIEMDVSQIDTGFTIPNDDDRILTYVVHVLDASENPVSGATVNLKITYGIENDFYPIVSDANGQATIEITYPICNGGQDYIGTVTNISKSDYTYNSSLFSDVQGVIISDC